MGATDWLVPIGCRLSDFALCGAGADIGGLIGSQGEEDSRLRFKGVIRRGDGEFWWLYFESFGIFLVHLLVVF